MANLYFEDVEVGDCCLAGPYLVTKSEIIQFALRPCMFSDLSFASRRQRALAFAADRGFGVIVAADERGPRASHVPFVIDRRDDGVILSRSISRPETRWSNSPTASGASC